MSDNLSSSGSPRPKRQVRSRTNPTPRGGIALTPRDVEMLADIFLHSVMTRSQIQELYFTSTPRCNDRLRQLFDHQYLLRHNLPMVLFTAPFGAQAIYSLGPQAVPHVASYLEKDLEVVREGQRRASSPTFVEHALEIVNTRLAFLRAITAHPNVRLERWLAEPECRYEYTVLYPSGSQLEVFKPDGFIRLEVAGRHHCYFIEVDLGHTSKTQFLGKLLTHSHFLDTGVFNDVYEDEAFRTLVITTSPTRVNNLISYVEAEKSQLFWFTTFDQVKNHGILEAIWRIPFEHELTALV